MDFEIRAADPAHPEIADLIATHIAYGDAAYPSESNHHLTPDAHTEKSVTLFAAWENENCLGMLGLMSMSATEGEIKSMHVRARARGRGVGAALLAHIIEHAADAGIDTLYLETGSREASAASRRLYQRGGFVPCPPFGNYKADPESLFMVRKSEIS